MQNSPLASNYPQKSMRIGSTFYFCGLLKKVAACSIFAFCVGSARFNGGQISFGDNKLLLSAMLCTILGTTSCYLALELSAVRCTICAQDVIVCLAHFCVRSAYVFTIFEQSTTSATWKGNPWVFQDTAVLCLCFVLVGERLLRTNRW